MTDLLIAADQRSTVASTIDPVITGLKGQLDILATTRASLQIFVAPPLFRPMPAWYNQHLPWIANQWSAIMTSDRLANLHLIPSPVSQELAPDGINLTPVSGLHYVIHLFDRSIEILNTALAPPEQKQLSIIDNSPTKLIFTSLCFNFKNCFTQRHLTNPSFLVKKSQA